MSCFSNREVFHKYDLLSSPCEGLPFIRVTHAGRSFSSEPSVRASAAPARLGVHRRPGPGPEGELACLPSACAQAATAPPDGLPGTVSAKAGERAGLSAQHLCSGR